MSGFVDFGLQRDMNDLSLSVLVRVTKDPALGQYAFDPETGRYIPHPDEPAPLFGRVGTVGPDGSLQEGGFIPIKL